MSPLAPTLQAFFTDRLLTQRQVSPATIAAYRDTFRLLLGFINDLKHITPADLDFVEKRFDRAIVSFLTKPEVEAILAIPDRDTWIGRRDHALLTLAVHTGLRVAELTGLRHRDLVLTTGPHDRCYGKGRKQRSTPLTTQTTATMREWLRASNSHSDPDLPLFPARTGTRLSTDAVEWLLRKYAIAAALNCSSLATRSVTPHVLRHTAAMFLRFVQLCYSGRGDSHAVKAASRSGNRTIISASPVTCRGRFTSTVSATRYMQCSLS